MCFMFRQKINNKSRYNGCYMNTYLTVLPGAAGVTRLPKLSRDARQRVAWFDQYAKCGNIAKTCRHFGISRKTFHKWKQRYSPYLLSSLEDRSRRPARVRIATTPREHVFLVRRLRTQYPYYSKYK